MAKSKWQSSLSSQHGQAVVEYVLMLVVSVAMVMALAYQIFKPMQVFLKDYMGTYVSCLLETGELPSLGNEATQQILADEGCSAKFQPASIAKGRPPVNSSNSSSSSAKGSSSDGTNSGSGSSGGGSGGGGDGSGSTNPNGASNGRNLLTSRNNRSATDAPGMGDGKTTEIPVDVATSKFYNRRSSAEYGGVDPSKKFNIGGAMISDDEKKKQARKEESNQTIKLPEGAGTALKKIALKSPERKIAEESEDEGFTLGNFMRFLLIAAMIIAIIVVLGGQALKIAKSGEK